MRQFLSLPPEIISEIFQLLTPAETKVFLESKNTHAIATKRIYSVIYIIDNKGGGLSSEECEENQYTTTLFTQSDFVEFLKETTFRCQRLVFCSVKDGYWFHRLITQFKERLSASGVSIHLDLLAKNIPYDVYKEITMFKNITSLKFQPMILTTINWEESRTVTSLIDFNAHLKNLELFSLVKRYTPEWYLSNIGQIIELESLKIMSPCSEFGFLHNLNSLKALTLCITNNIDHLDFKELRLLDKLEINRPMLNQISAFTLPPNLKEFHISGGHDFDSIVWREIPISLQKITFERVELSGDLPRMVFLQEKLIELNISENAFFRSLDLSELRSLKSLNVDYNLDLDLSYVKWPPFLEKLSAESCLVSSILYLELPPSLKSLKIGEVFNPPDEDIISALPKGLEYLSLHDYVKELKPDSFKSFTKLKSLHLTLLLDMNILNFVPYIHGLEELSLKSNNIMGISSDVVFPGTLKILDLSSNYITSLKGVKFPSRLKILNLKSNKLTDLDEVEFPESLDVLDLSLNRLSSSLNVSKFKYIDEIFLFYPQPAA